MVTSWDRLKDVTLPGKGKGSAKPGPVSIDFHMPSTYPGGTPAEAQYPNLPPLMFIDAARCLRVCVLI